MQQALGLVGGGLGPAVEKKKKEKKKTIEGGIEESTGKGGRSRERVHMRLQ